LRPLPFNKLVPNRFDLASDRDIVDRRLAPDERGVILRRDRRRIGGKSDDPEDARHLLDQRIPVGVESHQHMRELRQVSQQVCVVVALKRITGLERNPVPSQERTRDGRRVPERRDNEHVPLTASKSSATRRDREQRNTA
jgi:hypothetical protein